MYAALSALTVFLMIKLRAGRRWVRSLLALLAIMTLLLAVLRTLAGTFPPLLVTASAVLTLVLLYLPSANAFFAARTP